MPKVTEEKFGHLSQKRKLREKEAKGGASFWAHCWVPNFMTIMKNMFLFCCGLNEREGQLF